MSTRLSQQDREILKRLADRKPKPTRRQKALALLGFARGEPLEKISERVGIAKSDLEGLLQRFDKHGLMGVGLAIPSRGSNESAGRARIGSIELTPGICGGSARVAGTRIPVWLLVEARDLGVSEAQLLLDYPALKAVNLVDAWDYASRHPEEIAAEILGNEVA